MSRLSSLIRKEIFQHRNRGWNKRLAELDERSNPFWNICKALRKKHTPIPPLVDRSKVYAHSHEKAEALASNFLKNHYVSDHLSYPSHEDAVTGKVAQLHSLSVSTPPTDYVKVEYIKLLIEQASP